MFRLFGCRVVGDSARSFLLNPELSFLMPTHSDEMKMAACLPARHTHHLRPFPPRVVYVYIKCPHFPFHNEEYKKFMTKYQLSYTTALGIDSVMLCGHQKNIIIESKLTFNFRNLEARQSSKKWRT